METWGWLAENSFNLLSAAGVLGSLLFTAQSLRSETRTRRVANLLTISANHREIWKTWLTQNQLVRVRDAVADIRQQPITDAERMFVTFVIHHMSTVYYAMSDQLVVKVEGLRRDIAQFLSLPIPNAVWNELKVLQNDDFVAFVESCRNWK